MMCMSWLEEGYRDWSVHENFARCLSAYRPIPRLDTKAQKRGEIAGRSRDGDSDRANFGVDDLGMENGGLAYLLELLDGTLVDAAALVDQVTGGGGLDSAC